MNRC